MLLMPAAKKVASIIVSGPKKPDFVQDVREGSETGEYTTPEDEPKAEDEYVSHARDLVAAVDQKDVERVAAILRALCKGE